MKTTSSPEARKLVSESSGLQVKVPWPCCAHFSFCSGVNRNSAALHASDAVCVLWNAGFTSTMCRSALLSTVKQVSNWHGPLLTADGFRFLRDALSLRSHDREDVENQDKDKESHFWAQICPGKLWSKGVPGINDHVCLKRNDILFLSYGCTGLRTALL